MQVMSETKAKIIEAAIEAFSRYGIRKTNMGDVAKAAGMSRQTLYSNFKGKDELLAATMTEVIDQIIRDLESDWKTCQTLSEVIDVYYDHAVFKPFAIMQTMPDAKDLIKGVGENTIQVAKQSEQEKAHLLAEHLEPFAKKFVAHALTPLAVAQLIVRSANDFKLSAVEFSELSSLLMTLKRSILALAN